MGVLFLAGGVWRTLAPGNLSAFHNNAWRVVETGHGYHNNAWRLAYDPGIVASGGSVSEFNDGTHTWRVHQWANWMNGDETLRKFNVTLGGYMEFMFLGGGGGGGWNTGGGGGAGGLLHFGAELGPGEYTVIVGSGGLGAYAWGQAHGFSGNGSVLLDSGNVEIIHAVGGGGGGSGEAGSGVSRPPGQPGGSGGGGGSYPNLDPPVTQGGAGTPDQGHNGGQGRGYGAGGGGGRGGQGGSTTDTSNIGATGGPGVVLYMTGTQGTSFGGGGGGAGQSASGGASHGGGYGGLWTTHGPAAGVDNLGGGGGGGWAAGDDRSGGQGGHGFAIIRYII